MAREEMARYGIHEQSPGKLAEEVGEYIITGRYDDRHSHHKRVPSGIHEQYVRLLESITGELDKPGGPELPASWISGFYGSGKSSFGGSLSSFGGSLSSSPPGHRVLSGWSSSNPKHAKDAERCHLLQVMIGRTLEDRREHARGARRVIPKDFITEWRARAPWTADRQVEHDLIASARRAVRTPDHRRRACVPRRHRALQAPPPSGALLRGYRSRADSARLDLPVLECPRARGARRQARRVEGAREPRDRIEDPDVHRALHGRVAVPQ
jgi:hypothetical protein